MTLIKTSLLNGIAVAMRMLTLFGINKILAVYVGPAGFVLLGQFQNVVQLVTVFSSGAINTGVTKYTAEFTDDPTKQQRLWKTAGMISLTGSVVTAFILIVFNEKIAIWLLHDKIYHNVFVWFAAGLGFWVLNSLLLAILNGKAEIRLYVAANIAGSLLSFTITVILVVYQGLYGALVALSILQSVGLLFTFLLCRKCAWFRPRYLLGLIDRDIAKKLGRYTLMALTSAACAPIANILVRDYLIKFFDNHSAGYWDAMSRLSGGYMMLFTSILSVYYLPKYAKLQSGTDLRKEILNGYRFILPVITFCCICIFFLRDFIIMILFSPEFSPMRILFFWYQVGDILKIGSWVLAFLMLGKAMVRCFMLTEVTFTISYLLLIILFTRCYGLVGTAIAYAVNYLLYWLTLYIIMKNGILKDSHTLSVDG